MAAVSSIVAHRVRQSYGRAKEQELTSAAWLFEFTGGGVSGQVADSCYPQEHRQGAFTVAALHQWSQDEPPALDTQCVTTAEEWINEVIRPNSTGGPLPCVCHVRLSRLPRSAF